MRTFSLVAALALSCCNRSGQDSPASAPEAAEVAQTGKTGTASVRGSVLYKGAVPPTASRTTTAECSHLAGPAPATLAVSPEGGVRDAFVWVKDGLPPGQYAVPAEPVVLDQKGCEYAPRVVGVRAGQPVVLGNSDPVLHNVHAPAFNVPLTGAGTKVTRKFSRPDVMVPLTCDVHPWMRAWVGVVAHPFFAVTDAAGRFALQGLPAGTYTIEVWQEKLGRVTQQVTVAEGESKNLSVELKAP
jgi:hypothetical protein